MDSYFIKSKCETHSLNGTSETEKTSHSKIVTLPKPAKTQVRKEKFDTRRQM